VALTPRITLVVVLPNTLKTVNHWILYRYCLTSMKPVLLLVEVFYKVVGPFRLSTTTIMQTWTTNPR
jgi:hypothetical protein